jgi:hypothetical protein
MQGLSTIRTATEVLGLATIGGAAAVQRAYGAAYPLVPPKTVIAVAAATAVIARRRQEGPAIGVVVAGLLALGAFVMPNAADQLGQTGQPGLFYSTVAELVGIAITLLAGGAEIRARSRQGAQRAS